MSDHSNVSAIRHMQFFVAIQLLNAYMADTDDSAFEQMTMPALFVEWEKYKLFQEK